MIITTHAYARAGLIGNPSDGYYGKTIALLIRNFRATVQLWESPQFDILPSPGDLGRFGSLGEFLQDVRLHGYYGGMRLIKAAIKRFTDYCSQHDIPLKGGNFTISYTSDSAIVVATLRALMQFYNVQIPLHLLPTITLSVERDELGISAGLQDRVIQCYEGIVYMDFERQHLETSGYGIYEPLKPARVPPIYVAYDPRRAEVSDIPHRNLRALFNQGDPTVVKAMQTYRELTDRARAALLDGNWDELGRCINANFDLRRTIMNIAPENLRMVEAARSAGASAKFAGSGGAIVGLYRDGRHYQQLSDALASIRCTVIRPLIFEN